jgi:hypothetical protein
MGARVDSWCHRDMLSRAVEPHLRVPSPLQKDLSNLSLLKPQPQCLGFESTDGTFLQLLQNAKA